MVTAAARSAAAMLPLAGIAAMVIKHGSTVNCSSNDHHYSRSNSTLSLEAPFGWSGVIE